MSKAQTTLPFTGTDPESQLEELHIPLRVDNWDEYFLYMASVASVKSKDPNCQVGAVIASKDNVILSTGFNGLARGVHDDKETLQDGDEKLKVICHAEANAILNAARVGARVEGATIYVSKFPCVSCCNAIIQAGVKRIYTHDPEFWKHDPFDKDHSRKKRILHEAHIEVDAPYHPTFRPQAQITVPKRKPEQQAKPGPARAARRRRTAKAV
jgi:dCMP deaminase